MNGPDVVAPLVVAVCCTPFLQLWAWGYVHGYGYPANAHKLRTGQWWWSVNTSTHQSLSLNQTGHAPSFFFFFPPYVRRNSIITKIPSLQTRNLSSKMYKKRQKNNVGLRPAPPFPPPKRVLNVWPQWNWITITVHIALSMRKKGKTWNQTRN